MEKATATTSNSETLGCISAGRDGVMDGIKKQLKHEIGYRTPLLIVGLCIGGLISASANFGFFRYLHHRLPEDTIPQSWASLLGIAFAGLTSLSFGGALSIAYTQRVWYRFRSSPLSAHTIERLIGLPATPEKFISLSTLRSAWFEWLFALVCAGIPIATMLPPGALTIAPHKLPSVWEEVTVRTLGFDRNFNTTVSLEDLRTHSEIINFQKKKSPSEGLFFSPALPRYSTELLASRIVGSRESGNFFYVESPVGSKGYSGQNSTYFIDFMGPRLKCEELPELSDESLLFRNERLANLVPSDLFEKEETTGLYKWHYYGFIHSSKLTKDQPIECDYGVESPDPQNSEPYLSFYGWFRGQCHNCGSTDVLGEPAPRYNSNFTAMHCVPGVSQHGLKITFENGIHSLGYRKFDDTTFEPITTASIREIFSDYYRAVSDTTKDSEPAVNSNRPAFSSNPTIDLLDEQTPALEYQVGSDFQCYNQTAEERIRKTWGTLTGKQIQRHLLHMQSLIPQRALFDRFVGNITWFGDETRDESTLDPLQFPFAQRDPENPKWIDFNLDPETLEVLSVQIVVSLISSSMVRLPVMVEFTPWGNVYSFESWRLVVPYSIIAVVSVFFCAVGLHAMLHNGFAVAGGFLQIVESTSGSRVLRELGMESAVAAGPAPSVELRKVKLVYGQVLVDEKDGSSITKGGSDGYPNEKGGGTANSSSSTLKNPSEGVRKVWTFGTEDEIVNSAGSRAC
ncbi:hypothetical protein BJ508DRAFT_414724 [Ascobolus immersus RN42]|uniref:Uncharacterized protein n=1 Tax=Ascobolus immersus RN42 TaxID=1160509 RepID=A0A3N4I5W6_ASCIM|nr:hypothetical protein BJ508DRAFT_414724 [Ascobolus immersus RN42]